MEMGKKIRLLRVEKNLSQEDLAEMVGVEQRTISKAELGIHNNIHVIAQIANVLGVSLDWLADGDQDYPPPRQPVTTKQRKR